MILVVLVARDLLDGHSKGAGKLRDGPPPRDPGPDEPAAQASQIEKRLQVAPAHLLIRLDLFFQLCPEALHGLHRPLKLIS